MILSFVNIRTSFKLEMSFFFIYLKVDLSYHRGYFIKKRGIFHTFHFSFFLRSEATMRRQHYAVLLLVIALFSNIHGQDTSTTISTTTPWSGDPKLCPPNPGPAPQREMPEFASRVEFALEQIEYEEIGTTGVPGHRTMEQHIFDYDANALIVVKNRNNIITSEYYYYKDRKKSVYLGTEYCQVQSITENKDMGSSWPSIDRCSFERQSSFCSRRHLRCSVGEWNVAYSSTERVSSLLEFGSGTTNRSTSISRRNNGSWHSRRSLVELLRRSRGIPNCSTRLVFGEERHRNAVGHGPELRRTRSSDHSRDLFVSQRNRNRRSR